MSMQHGIGVKEVYYRPMTQGEFAKYLDRPWDTETEFDPGYLVEYKDGGKGNHPDHAGYISWSPKDVFEKAYRPTSAMSFGLAIEAMKRGHRVARKGWNGKGLFIFLVENWTYTDGKQDNLRNLPTLVMKTVDDCAVPWLASQTDMLADDWVVIE